MQKNEHELTETESQEIGSTGRLIQLTLYQNESSYSLEMEVWLN